MNIKNNENDQYETFITGLGYSGILAIILLLICFAINDSLFDNSLTFIIIGIVCVSFFISGLKRVFDKKIAFLRTFGARRFDKYYSEGIWWIFPLFSFEQMPHFDILNENEGDLIRFNFVTKEKIPLDIQVKYFWKVEDRKVFANNYNPTYIKSELEHELGKFVRNRNAIELLIDTEISSKVMVNYLEKAGKEIGIAISKVFPNINYENQYIPVVRKLQKDFTELQFEFDKLLKLKTVDPLIYHQQIKNCINDLKLSNEEAMTFIKVYKSQVNLNENTYNINIGELNKIIDSLITFFKG